MSTESAAAPRAEDPAAGQEPTLDGAFAPDGVDLTVIRWMLGLSPAERLAAAQAMADLVWARRERREA